jgi:nicotinate-nucleotide pyrophosphorylase (carboxylating)
MLDYMKTFPKTLDSEDVAALARRDVVVALAEDLGSGVSGDVPGGDLTAGLIDPERRARARILARESAVLCGTPWVTAALTALDPAVQLSWHVGEGQRCEANQTVLEIQGSARALLSAERTALNFLQLLSGVATKTAVYVAAVAGTGAQIVDTRKTLPGLRLAQKYAVKTGGGVNHRIGLFDAILIKENHIAAAGGIAQVLAQAQAFAGAAKFVEIEVETLEQLREALAHGATMVLLDNMDVSSLRAAVAINKEMAVHRAQGAAVLEISGGVTLTGLRTLAETGVDRISIGALTKDVTATDFSMRFEAL